MNFLINTLMISKEEFFSIIKEHNDQEERLETLSKVGITIWDSKLIEFGYGMFERVIKSNFNETGAEWIFWWLYERPFNSDKDLAWDQDKNPIPTKTLDDLWNIIKDHRK